MSYIIEKIIPNQDEIKQNLQVTEDILKLVEKDRKEICDIIEGKDKRKILILGPCSAWPNLAVIEYANKIKPIAELVKDKIKIILRVYTQKPRTTLGWTGPANQPDPFSISDLEKGIIYSRNLMIEILKIGLPIADEALFTHNEGYYDDLLSWIAIGARSSEDQEHRIFASMINHPVGMKNPTSGDLDIAINSVIAAQHSHVFLLNQKQIRTLGNAHAHLVLRGGNGKSNIFYDDLNKAKDKLFEAKVQNPSIIIDCSHDNSIDPSTGKKDPLFQPEVLLRVMEHINDNKELKKIIKGFMIESFLKTGNQNLKIAKNLNDLDLTGLSVTDACIGINETKELIEQLYEEL